MSPLSRREFLKASIAVGALGSVGSLSVQAAPRTATDRVTLGKSGMRVTRLAFGTGSNNGHVEAAWWAS
jgi:FtsP/CotA-like multicopper oxidase with cupredoxin domain